MDQTRLGWINSVTWSGSASVNSGIRMTISIPSSRYLYHKHRTEWSLDWSSHNLICTLYVFVKAEDEPRHGSLTYRRRYVHVTTSLRCWHNQMSPPIANHLQSQGQPNFFSPTYLQHRSPTYPCWWYQALLFHLQILVRDRDRTNACSNPDDTRYFPCGGRVRL